MGELLRWRGILDGVSTNLRRMAAGVLMLFGVMLVFAQWGFLGCVLADGRVFYAVTALVPVALAAVLLGTRAGVAVGLWTGATVLVHMMVLPLDYYEVVYATLGSDAVAMTACGLVAGVLFASIARAGLGGWRRVACVVLACLAAAGAYNVFACMLNDSVGVFEAVAQTPADAAFMTVFVLGAIFLADRGILEVRNAGLRSIFGARLSTVVLAAFMVVVTVSHTALAARSIATAQQKMADECYYLLRQMSWTEKIDAQSYPELTQGAEYQSVSQKVLAEALEGYTEESDGLVILSKDGYVVASNVSRVVPGRRLSDYLIGDVDEGVKRSIATNEAVRVVYWAPNAYNDLVDLPLPGDSPEAWDQLSTWQIGYTLASVEGRCQVTIIRPFTLVFTGSIEVAGWVALSALFILVLVYLLTRRLLDQLVGQRIDATNAALAGIVDGDLDVRMPTEGTPEFARLSEGINQTVDALKGWIADAEGRMDAELEAARSIQESALPSVFPPYPDIKRFDIYANMNAAKEVGGDFYDFFLIGDESGPNEGKLAFVLADVSGKGVPAALFMMKAKTQLHDYLESGMELGEAVENANRQLCLGNEDDMFVTAWVGILDYGARRIDFVNAGHNPPLLQQDDEWRFVTETSGMPLGLFDGLPYSTHSIECNVGDMLLIYTDGVTEAFSVDEEQYGEDRLVNLVEDCFALHPHELVDRVSYSVASYSEGAEQSDDITMLALEVGVPPEEKEVLTVPASMDEVNTIFDFICGELDRRLCPVRVQNQVQVAVEELFVNVCKYAYAGLGEEVDRYVRVTYAYSADPTSLTVEIIDDGAPFDPVAAHEEGDSGLGIMMAARSVDEMRYERVGDTNVVILVKYW